MAMDLAQLDQALSAARERLLRQRGPEGHWTGELSASAVSTATAVCALAVSDRPRHEAMVKRGLSWLADNANADGGWGDSPGGLSNVSATLLGRCAFAVAGQDEAFSHAVSAAEAWVARHAGGTAPGQIVAAVHARYGNDRTFSAPILAVCAIAGLLGRDAPWRHVPALPFELAACPHRLLRWLRLPVVSYALPALVAIGQARHRFAPPGNPLVRLARNALRQRTLRVLADIQPASGGFLEAAPLTAFVVACLSAAGERDHPVVAAGVRFLIATVRPDGSWPIDSNLATWLTTLSVNALAAVREGNGQDELAPGVRDWLLAQQQAGEHPYTRAAPGGWAWTDLSGGVPDADDTAGALLALRNLPEDRGRIRAAALAGAKWLLDLQNADGGMPTFCRGWGRLPFDRSSPDLAAHAVRAWSAWLGELPTRLQARARRAIARACRYLEAVQRPDGAWTPLWFGNQFAPRQENLTYGASRVLLGLAETPAELFGRRGEVMAKGLRWLRSAQNADGGWGGSGGVASSIEETALAVEALAAVALGAGAGSPPDEESIGKGVAWLIRNTHGGREFAPSPIGFYFASLWYFDRLYPIIFTVGALARAGAAARASRP